MLKLLKIAKRKPKTAKGFSFVEVMLSVFLMSAGMLSAISLIGGGIKESADSRNQIIASLLAQEGVELVRNVRDTNWATSGNTSFVGFPMISPANNCRIDSRLVNVIECGIQTKDLRYNANLHLYSHTTTDGSPTKFSRLITIVNSGNDKVVTSIVSWKGSFPTEPYSTTCTTGAGCAYAQSTLTTWSE